MNIVEVGVVMAVYNWRALAKYTEKEFEEVRQYIDIIDAEQLERNMRLLDIVINLQNEVKEMKKILNKYEKDNI